MDRSDIEALERRIGDAIAAGDLQKAASEGMRGYGPEILRYLVSVLRDRQLGEDVFDEFAEEMWKSLPRFRGDSSFRTWAYAVAWNLVQRGFRDRARHPVDRLTTGAMAGLAASVRSATAPYLQTEARDRLARIREELEPVEETILLLRVNRNLPWKDIAAILAAEGEPVDEAAVRKRFQRLRDKLRTLMDR